MKKKIKDREAEFIKQLEPFIEKYGKKMLVEFADYWTEVNQNGKKMRFEKEATFGISRRLSTWDRNDKKWNKTQPIKISAATAFDNAVFGKNG